MAQSTSSVHKIDEIDELFASNNKYKQLYKFMEKRYLVNKDILDNPFKIFYGIPFYRFDLTREEHLKEYDKSNGRCCFNHFIGMPEKHGKVFPFFEYEKVLWEDFEKSLRGESNQRLFAVLKATGIGMTEYIIRVMAWMAVSSSRYVGARFAIIAGIRMNIAEMIIDRFVNLFHRFPFLGIKAAKARTMVNHVTVEAYPAVNLDAMRSFHNLAFVFVDEADFFRKSLQKSIRTVIERYIAKTNPFVYLVSTPDKPYGLFYELFREQTEDQCIYKRYEFDYTWGEGTIFTRKEIIDQMGSNSFQQEYNLQFGGTVGNLFSEKAIMRNVLTHQEAESIQFAPYYTYSAIDYEDNNGPNYIARSLGVDPGFGRNPKAGYAEELIQPDFNELVDIISVMISKTGTTKVFTDSSNPSLIRSLKRAIGEKEKYGDIEKKELERKIYRGDMVICPVPFNTKAREMMYSLKELVDNGLLVIHERQRNVIDCMKSAVVVNEKLNKEMTSHDDLFDALRLSINNYPIGVKKTILV
ncbi:MAG: putative terminase, large subunit [Nitrososphaeraceae archaeon]|nr:putative terminase, large subunit [Nitrososphaeraceae archaeon]